MGVLLARPNKRVPVPSFVWHNKKCLRKQVGGNPSESDQHSSEASVAVVGRERIKLRSSMVKENLKVSSLWASTTTPAKFQDTLWCCWPPGFLSVVNLPFLQLSYSFGDVLYFTCSFSPYCSTKPVLCSSLSTVLFNLLGPPHIKQF